MWLFFIFVRHLLFCGKIGAFEKSRLLCWRGLSIGKEASEGLACLLVVTHFRFDLASAVASHSLFL